MEISTFLTNIEKRKHQIRTTEDSTIAADALEQSFKELRAIPEVAFTNVFYHKVLESTINKMENYINSDVDKLRFRKPPFNTGNLHLVEHELTNFSKLVDITI